MPEHTDEPPEQTDEPPAGELALTSNSREYTEGGLDLSPSETPFYADGVDPDSIPH